MYTYTHIYIYIYSASWSRKFLLWCRSYIQVQFSPGVVPMAAAKNMTAIKKTIGTTEAAYYAASWLCAVALIGLILVAGMRESSTPTSWESTVAEPVRGGQLLDRPCEEIYVVGEGETLHTISDKCKDPFIVERNPHIHDPDDVFPGLVIRITPSD